ncbi:pseudouridine synthase [Apiosordaria backusii]|uniref:Pseudouridine synthase n=1 Tax=Apiosordaria backusii TaxID=314023 RepID=A0AA40DJY2_9PEZI|nr:pseudouridine synthase [Apiosordaria backusii]
MTASIILSGALQHPSTATVTEGRIARDSTDGRPEPSSIPQPQAPTSLSPPPPYFFKDGLRRVAPYFYTYNTWCKERWRGRKIIEVFESEFRERPVEYYRAALESGQVAVNGKTVSPDYVMDPVQVIHEDDDMVVINKPSGVPVHPAGRYHYNSVVEIMKAERGPAFAPRPCNRLDRLTSGIMFIAKTAKAAESLSAQIFRRSVRKEYLARVVGRFPDGEVVCDQPILQISPKLGLNRVRANGKSAKTVFKRLAYYPPPVTRSSSSSSPSTEQSETGALGDQFTREGEGYSIVRCLPVTGRTHQIRVHLQFLGHPVQNDPIYANQKVWGFDLGRDDAEATQNSDDDVLSRLSRMGKEQVADAVAYYDEMVDVYHKKKAERMSGELCAVCETPLYTDPGSQELSLWLHSLRYEDADGSWSYVSPLPAWAMPPEGASGPTQAPGGIDDLVEAAGEDMNIGIS